MSFNIKQILNRKCRMTEIVSVLILVAILISGWTFYAHSKLSDETLKRMRHRMVERQIKARGIENPKVLEAMREVKRHLFVPEKIYNHAYDDSALPIGEDQTISQPYIVALMTNLLKPDKDDKVLEIGTGSGYQAAVLAKIVKEVYTIEIVEELGKRAAKLLEKLDYENVHTRIGDGYKGWPEKAPFDGVIVTAAPDHVPEPLVEQLKVGGRMVIPVGDRYQELMLITKNEEGVRQEQVIPVRFVPMTGEAEDK